MNAISEQLFQTIDVMVDNKIQQLQFDKTIQATVYEVRNLDTGEYRVRYQGNIFSAYSDDLEKQYEVDDEVYVNVPEGNFSNRKLIISTVTAQSLSYGQLQQLKNTIVSVSPSLTLMYPNVEQEPYKVVAGSDPQSAVGTDWIYRGPDTYSSSDLHGMFQQYLRTHNLLRISASFLTQFHCTHTQGNYGIELEFYTKEDTSVSFRLDLTQFNGNPYSFSVYAPQFVVVELPKDYLLGLKSIKLLQENFVPDKFIENGQVTDKENLTTPNIFCNSLSIDFVEVHDLTDSTYYLKIGAPQGIVFSNSVSSLDLVGELIYQGNNIMDNKKCACEWFVRDLRIMLGSPDYNKAAGVGWRSLGATDSILHLTTSDVACRQNYKLVVVYNENTTLTSEIQIINQLSAYNLELAQITEGEDVLLKITDDSLFGNWYMSFPDGSYVDVPGATHVNSIVINAYLQYSSVTFYCAVETADRVSLGTLDFVINNSNSGDDITVNYIGEDLFRYDANGDVAVEEAEKDRTLQVNLAWKDGSATSYIIAWIMQDGENHEIQIPKQKGLNPENSMLSALWVDSQNILHYNIRQKYKVNYNNNTLLLKVTTMFGDSYFFEKEILFLKDGDQGTNGTTYIAAIRPCDSNGGKLSGLHPLVYQDSWRNTLPIRCYVYKDGELINSAPAYAVEYEWTGTNLQVVGSTDRVTLQGLNSGLVTWEFCVRVKVTIREKATAKTINIYASYPVDIAVNGINYSLVDIDQIPSYIKYSSSGVLPRFQDRNLEYRYNGQVYNDLITAINPDVLDIKVDLAGNRYLDPTATFTFEDDTNIGVLELRDPGSGVRRLVHPIIMYLDNYGNEAINGWDGTKLTIDEQNGEYLFAPQVGAGVKDSYNRFSGVVMGKDSAQDMTGLYGYQQGENTFGLLENGTAFFGSARGGGRITIDGRSATIEGGNGGSSTRGMTITLADRSPNGNSDAIRVGNGNFYVKYDGSMSAMSATIRGEIQAESGRIGCDASGFGGWIITQDRLYSGSGKSYVALDSGTESFAIWAGSDARYATYSSSASDLDDRITNGAPFMVTRDGFVQCTNAYIKGRISASQGEIGGWIITDTKLYNGDVGMASTGHSVFWAGTGLSDQSVSPGNNPPASYFLVTSGGKLYCRSAEVKGALYAESGRIGCANDGTGGWEISTDKISGTKTKGADGAQVNIKDYIVLNCAEGTFKVGDNFSVDAGGNVKVTGTITATGGRIGDWAIQTAEQGSGICYSPTGPTTATIYLRPHKGPTEQEDVANKQYAILFNINDSGIPDTYFKVDRAGKVMASNADIQGKITATSGKIGGWYIGNNLQNWDPDDPKAEPEKPEEKIYIGPNGWRFFNNFVLEQNESGSYNLTINGNINATGGQIGGWKINGFNLESSNGAIILDGATGTIHNATNSVTIYDGNGATQGLQATGGTIGGWTINGSSLGAVAEGSGIQLSPSEITVGSSTISSNGTITLGGTGSISMGGTTLHANGSITTGGNFSVDSDGNFTINSLSFSSSGQAITFGGTKFSQGAYDSGLTISGTSFFVTNLMHVTGGLKIAPGDFQVDVSGVPNLTQYINDLIDDAISSLPSSGGGSGGEEP